MSLALYIETRGLTKHIAFGDKFHSFGELKRLIKSGEFNNIDELENSVYEMFGIVDKDLDSDGFSDMIKEMGRLANGKGKDKGKPNERI